MIIDAHTHYHAPGILTDAEKKKIFSENTIKLLKLKV
ncbi:MAG: hypothetical protein ACI82H_002142 [Alphaproteobacteria bacterium]|jgi:hypothetical protein